MRFLPVAFIHNVNNALRIHARGGRDRRAKLRSKDLWLEWVTGERDDRENDKAIREVSTFPAYSH